MAKKRTTSKVKARPISAVVRAALEACDRTQAEIARDTGIAESVLSRFRSGEYLRGANLDRLAAYLNVEAVVRRGATKKGGRSER
jgi:transcriptional regulator with XRE-family HTH domain